LLSFAAPDPSPVMQRHLSCDGAVHNVGTNIRKPTIEYSDDDYQQIMSANLESTYKLSQVPFNK